MTDRQETMNSMRSTLKEMAEHRLEIKKMLASNPHNRVELEAGLVRVLDHEEMMRDSLRELEFYDKVEPLMKEAMKALDTGDHTTIDEAMTWHAARGNEFAQAYLKHVNSFEYQQQSDEVEAAFAWHPAWHKSDDRSWECDTPDDPEVWETDKLLAQYRRHLASQH